MVVRLEFCKRLANRGKSVSLVNQQESCCSVHCIVALAELSYKACVSSEKELCDCVIRKLALWRLAEDPFHLVKHLFLNLVESGSIRSVSCGRSGEQTIKAVKDLLDASAVHTLQCETGMLLAELLCNCKLAKHHQLGNGLGKVLIAGFIDIIRF